MRSKTAVFVGLYARIALCSPSCKNIQGISASIVEMLLRLLLKHDT